MYSINIREKKNKLKKPQVAQKKICGTNHRDSEIALKNSFG